MNTDKHGLKKYFVVLKKTKNGVGMGSVYFSVNQWLIREKMGGFPRFKDINFTLDKEKYILIILNIENT